MVNSATLNSDYRNTSYSSFDINIIEKKENYLSLLLEKKGEVASVYNVIKNRNDELNNLFKDIYTRKCAYCGVSVRVLDNSRFEIDHVIPKSILKKTKTYTEEYINGIFNLVNSCQMCNRGKSSYYITEDYIEKLHPDSNNLSRIFYRDKDYSIKIIEEHESDLKIKAFYHKLKLSNEIRRINHLLMEMHEFCDIHKDLPIEIYELLIKIDQKRKYNF